MFETGKWAKIIDVKTGNIIVAGQIVSRKDCSYDKKYDCISFDNRWFFNLNRKNTFNVISNPLGQQVQFDEKLADNYIKVYWNQKDDDDEADIYRDWDINELDPEVKSLVNVLNKFEGIKTVTSCCGHNEFPLQVTIQFSDIHMICLIAKVLYMKFNRDFILSTKYNIVNNNLDRVLLDLYTTAIGEEAYQKAEELTKELEKWAKAYRQE